MERIKTLRTDLRTLSGRNQLLELLSSESELLIQKVSNKTATKSPLELFAFDL